MDLAEKIIEFNKYEQEQAEAEAQAQEHSEEPEAEEKRGFFNVPLPEVDEFGLPTEDSVDYFVARVLLLDDESREGHLHMRNDGRIWKGNRWVSENQENLYRLADWMYPLKVWQKEAIWKRIREVLPSLSKDKYVVTDDLVWNRKEARLERVEDKPKTVK